MGEPLRPLRNGLSGSTLPAKPVNGFVTRRSHVGGGPSTREEAAESLQVERPAAVAADGFARALPAFAVAVEIAVLELHPGSLRALGDETHLDLAGLLEVGLDL